MGAPDLCFDDLVSLSLCEVDGPPANSQPSSAKYFKCPAGVTVRHLVRLLMLKMGWDTPNDCGVQCGNNKIEMMYEIGGAKGEVEVLDPSWTLMDLACIFEWKRVSWIFTNVNYIFNCFLMWMFHNLFYK